MRTIRLYHPESLSKNLHVELSADARRHLVTVLRAESGQEIELFNGDGFSYQGHLTEIKKKSAIVTIEQQVKVENESPIHIHLYQGVSRGDKMDLTIQKAVELGVNEITPLLTERCGVKLNNERMEKKVEHWQRVVVSACEQSGRNIVPKVNEPIQFSRLFSEHNLSGLILNPYADKGMAELTPQDTWSIMIGPEGGFSDEEVDFALKQGCDDVKMGPRILRTETAGLAMLACLQAQFGDWR